MELKPQDLLVLLKVAAHPPQRWTYAALDEAIQRAVGVLETRYGVQQGQRIATLARNSADLLVLQQAAMRLGAIFVPVNWRLAGAEQQTILADCDPVLLLHDAALEMTLPKGCVPVEVAAFAAAVAVQAPAPRRSLAANDAPYGSKGPVVRTDHLHMGAESVLHLRDSLRQRTC